MTHVPDHTLQQVFLTEGGTFKNAPIYRLGYTVPTQIQRVQVDHGVTSLYLYSVNHITEQLINCLLFF